MRPISILTEQAWSIRIYHMAKRLPFALILPAWVANQNCQQWRHIRPLTSNSLNYNKVAVLQNILQLDPTLH